MAASACGPLDSESESIAGTATGSTHSRRSHFTTGPSSVATDSEIECVASTPSHRRRHRDGRSRLEIIARERELRHYRQSHYRDERRYEIVTELENVTMTRLGGMKFRVTNRAGLDIGIIRKAVDFATTGEKVVFYRLKI